MIGEGRPLAVEIWNEWKPSVMPPNPNMTDDDIDAVMAYVEAVYTGALGGEAAAGADVAVAPESEGLNRYWVIGGLAVALLLLIFILWNILGKLNQVSEIGRAHV